MTGQPADGRPNGGGRPPLDSAPLTALHDLCARGQPSRRVTTGGMAARGHFLFGAGFGEGAGARGLTRAVTQHKAALYRDGPRSIERRCSRIVYLGVAWVGCTDGCRAAYHTCTAPGPLARFDVRAILMADLV